MHQKVQEIGFEDRLKVGARVREVSRVSLSFWLEQLGRRPWQNCERENPAGEAGLAWGAGGGGGIINASLSKLLRLF